jgi:hypothetical protein
VFALGDGAVSPDVAGPIVSLGPSCCPQARVTAMGLEFGTQPMAATLEALRADAWRRAHPGAPNDQKALIARRLREAFFSDTEDWQGRVLGQARVTVLQALQGLASEG